jgi:hypothetical protein
MAVNFAIDWLSLTVKEDSTEDFFPYLLFGVDLPQWRPAAAKHGYTVAAEHPFGMIVMMNPDRPDMGRHMQISGRALKTIAARGRTGIEILKWAVAADISISRVDLAIDVKDEYIDLPTLFNSEVAKPITGRKRQQNIIQGKERGCTVYIGARTSDKFMRAYDKSAEMGLPESTLYTRFELEIKGKSARAAAKKLAGMSVEQAMKYTQGVMRSHWDVQSDRYREVMNAAGVLIETEKNTEHDRLTWLMETVAKSLAKTILELPHINVWDAFKTQVETFYEDLGGMIDEQDKEP